jgi:hypothetical protein
LFQVVWKGIRGGSHRVLTSHGGQGDGGGGNRFRRPPVR